MKPSELSGLIPVEVGEALAALAADVPNDQAIVEIGSFKGKSTCHLASGAKDGQGAHVWAIDPWDTPGNATGRFGFAESSTRRAFETQVRATGLGDRISAIQGFSLDVVTKWDGPRIGLLYIDGDHSETAVRADFEAWKEHLVPGATVAFDDLDTPKNPGVRIVVDELVTKGVLHDFQVEAERLAIGIVP
jgi:predicted O-methyltransferase YrrM